METELTLLTVLVCFFLFGCYPDGPGYVEDYDVVFTTFQDEYNFSIQQSKETQDADEMEKQQNNQVAAAQEKALIDN